MLWKMKVSLSYCIAAALYYALPKHSGIRTLLLSTFWAKWARKRQSVRRETAQKRELICPWVRTVTRALNKIPSVPEDPWICGTCSGSLLCSCLSRSAGRCPPDPWVPSSNRRCWQQFTVLPCFFIFFSLKVEFLLLMFLFCSAISMLGET